MLQNITNTTDDSTTADDVLYFEEYVYTMPQYITLVLVTITTSLLSLMGSMVIMYMAKQRLQTKTLLNARGRAIATPYSPVLQRLLIVLGFCDCISSIPALLMEFLVPPMMSNVDPVTNQFIGIGSSFQSGGGPWSFGSLGSCSFLAATSVFGTTSTALTSTALASYFYWLVVRSGGSGRRPGGVGGSGADEDKKMKWFQWGWFTVILLFPLSLTIAGFVLDNYGVLITPAVCWAGGDYPVGCDDINVPCIRGHGGSESGSEYLSDVAVMTILFSAMISTTFSILVWRSYRKQILRMRRFHFQNPNASNLTSNSSSTTTRTKLNAIWGRIKNIFSKQQQHETSIEIPDATNTSSMTHTTVTTGTNKGSSSMTNNIMNLNSNMNPNPNGGGSSTIPNIMNPNHANRQVSNTNEKLLREVAVQAVGYALVYLNMCVWYTICFVMTAMAMNNPEEGSYNFDTPLFLFWGKFFSVLLYPLQGFLNAVVYIRPTYQKWVQSNPQIPKYKLVYVCIAYPTEQPKPIERLTQLRTSYLRTQHVNEAARQIRTTESRKKKDQSPRTSSGVMSLRKSNQSVDVMKTSTTHNKKQRSLISSGSIQLVPDKEGAENGSSDNMTRSIDEIPVDLVTPGHQYTLETIQSGVNQFGSMQMSTYTSMQQNVDDSEQCDVDTMDETDRNEDPSNSNDNDDENEIDIGKGDGNDDDDRSMSFHAMVEEEENELEMQNSQDLLTNSTLHRMRGNLTNTPPTRRATLFTTTIEGFNHKYAGHSFLNEGNEEKAIGNGREKNSNEKSQYVDSHETSYGPSSYDGTDQSGSLHMV